MNHRSIKYVRNMESTEYVIVRELESRFHYLKVKIQLLVIKKIYFILKIIFIKKTGICTRKVNGFRCYFTHILFSFFFHHGEGALLHFSN